MESMNNENWLYSFPQRQGKVSLDQCAYEVPGNPTKMRILIQWVWAAGSESLHIQWVMLKLSSAPSISLHLVTQKLSSEGIKANCWGQNYRVGTGVKCASAPLEYSRPLVMLTDTKLNLGLGLPLAALYFSPSPFLSQTFFAFPGSQLYLMEGLFDTS